MPNFESNKYMFRKNIFIFLLTFCFSNIYGQCPLPSYALKDSACLNETVNIVNSGNPQLTYEWDFCPGDLNLTPFLNASSISISSPSQIKIIKDNENYYGFVTSLGNTNLFRLDFGNSLANAPTVTALTSSPLITAGLYSVDIKKEGNKWYAFVVGYALNKLIRLEFDSLNQLAPDITDVGVPGLSGSYKLHMYQHHVIVCNIDNNTIQRYNFDNGYANAPIQVLPVINTMINTPSGFEVAYDCPTNKYIGFSTNLGNATVTKFDFGSSLDSTPIASTFINTSTQPIGLDLVYDKDSWFLYVSQFGANSIKSVKIPSSLDNAPIILLDTTFGGTISSPFGVELFNFESSWYGFIANYPLNQVSIFNYPNACEISPPASELYNPGFTRNNPVDGWSYFTLAITDSNEIATHHYDSIYFFNTPPVANFSFSNACTGNTVSFYDSSSFCADSLNAWDWDFGDTFSSSSQFPTHIYSLPGSYNVTLTVFTTTGDSNSITKTVEVFSNPQADFNFANNACAQSEVLFTDSSITSSGSIANWSWKFGEGGISAQQNPGYTYNSGGIYTVTITVTSTVGCIDSVSKLINVLPRPQSVFSLTNTCIGQTTNFINASTISDSSALNYQWDFGYNGNTSVIAQPQFNYPLLQSDYTVTLIATSGNQCADTSVQTIHIGNQPVSAFSFSADTVCANSPVLLTNLSTYQSGDTIISYQWDFDDNTAGSSVINPTHSFTLPGIYNVNLISISPTFCSSNITKTLLVIPSPDVYFSYSGICNGTTTAFTDSSIAPAGSTLVSWHWDFGGGDTANTTNAQYQFPDTGLYLVSLTVTSSKGCTTTLIDSINISPLPVADFYSSPLLCNNTPVAFNDTTTVGSGSISSWQWNFCDNSLISIIPNPQHQYNSSGLFGVTLTATSDAGCSDDTTRYIYINTAPAGQILMSNQCSGVPVSFVFNESNVPTVTNNWLWTFGDGNMSNTISPVHIYNGTGSFTVTFQAFDLTTGCSQLFQDTVIIYPLPEATISLNNNCFGSYSILTDSSLISSGVINSWEWTSGNVTIATTQNTAYLFPTVGIHPIKLIARSDQGCYDTTTTLITIYALPVADFTTSPTYGEAPLSISITNASTGAVNYYWDFDDGDTSTLFEPMHVFLDTGIFNITLIAESNFGCIDTANQNIGVVYRYDDVALSDINFTLDGNFLTLYGSFLNLGNLPLTSLTIKSEVNEESTTIEYWSGLIDIANTKTYKLPTNYYISDLSNLPDFVCIEISQPNGKTDKSPENNRLCKPLSKTFSINNIYPNPTAGNTTLTVTTDKKDKIVISLISNVGQYVIPNKEYNLEKGINFIELSTTHLNSGIYSLRIDHNDNVSVLKIMKY